MDFRELLRQISGPALPAALPRAVRYLTSASGVATEEEAAPGLIQKPDGTVWLVNPDGSQERVGGGGSQTVTGQKTTILPAAMFTLDTVPVEVVPAPGTGKAVVLISASLSNQFGTTPYSGGFGLNIGYHGISPGATGYSFFPDAVCGASADTFCQARLDFPIDELDIGRPTAQVENKSLVVSADAGPIADGDGSFVVNCVYAIVDV